MQFEINQRMISEMKQVKCKRVVVNKQTHERYLKEKLSG